MGGREGGREGEGGKKGERGKQGGMEGEERREGEEGGRERREGGRERGGGGREREREREVSTQSIQSMIELGIVSVVFLDDILDYKEDSLNIVCSVHVVKDTFTAFRHKLSRKQHWFTVNTHNSITEAHKG